MLYGQICFGRHILQRLERIVRVQQLQQHASPGWWKTVQQFVQVDQKEHSMVWLQRLQTTIDGLRLNDDSSLVKLMRLLRQTETERNPLVDCGVKQAGGAQVMVDLRRQQQRKKLYTQHTHTVM